jgi:hypothetical protein
VGTPSHSLVWLLVGLKHKAPTQPSVPPSWPPLAMPQWAEHCRVILSIKWSPLSSMHSSTAQQQHVDLVQLCTISLEAPPKAGLYTCICPAPGDCSQECLGTDQASADLEGDTWVQGFLGKGG